MPKLNLVGLEPVSRGDYQAAVRQLHPKLKLETIRARLVTLQLPSTKTISCRLLRTGSADDFLVQSSG
ncbi:unnamed protein product [Clonostachys byssicola]|uniref:Uncharacterized protein n=1 Tax=Clonostachys byssicola TaxID=160290 RepID=A0A9N9U8W4_9HYPO|nr:unnamed protein product [Clonostachys byssicola]